MAGPLTYPNEIYPGDVAILALDGTIDARTGLPFIAKGVGPNSTPTYEIHYNRRQQRENLILAATRMGMVVDEGSLKIGVYPITYRLGGAAKTFAGATNQTVPDNAVRGVFLDSANALQIQTAFPSDATSHFPLATVTAAAGVLTIVDERPGVLFNVPTTAPSGRTLPFAPSVFVVGTLAVTVSPIEWVAPVAFTLKNVTGRIATAPAGASLIVDVRVNGTSLFPQQSDMVVIAAGTQQDTSATVNAPVAAGDVVTFEVEQIGSTTPGANLTIVLNGRTSVVID